MQGLMQKLLSTFVLLAFATTLFAKSPFVGTWKLDSAKTKYTAGPAPKDVTLVIEEQGDDLQIAATGVNADGSTFSEKTTVPVKGGAGHDEGGPFDAVTAKVIGRNAIENTYTKDGKEVLSRRAVVSKDGKTMRVTVKGLGAAGKTVAGLAVMDKQL
jgi:hypothetical protein